MLAKNTMRHRPKANRETIEYQLCKFWQSRGKLSWTDEELQRAVDKILQESIQTPLFDTGTAAAQSRAAAFKESKQTDYRQAIVSKLADYGAKGATRAELAEILCCQQSSICRPILELIHSGEIRETADRRTSRFGGNGCVLVLSQFAEVTANG